MFAKPLIKIMLLLVLLPNPGTVQSRAMQAYCLQFDTGFASHFYVANPQDKTIKPLPDDQPAFPYATDKNQIAPGGRYIAQVQAARGKEAANGGWLLVIGDRLTWRVSVLQTSNNFDFTNFNFAWSPDGRSIAYIWQVGHDSQIATYISIADADGKNQRIAALWPLGITATLRWSADGVYIAVLSGVYWNKIFSTSTLQPVLIGLDSIVDVNFSWSSRGHRFFAQIKNDANESRYVIVTPETSIEREVAIDQLGLIPGDGYRLWSPDGTRLAFVELAEYDRARISILSLIDGSIWGPLDGPEQKYGGEGYMPPLDIGWSSDSRYLLYARPLVTGDTTSPNPHGSELVAADVQAKRLKVLAPAIAWRDIEPATARSLDGKRIAVPVQNKGRAAVLLINPDGTKQVILKNNGAYIVDLLWSPNSQYIAYVAGVGGEEIPGIKNTYDYVDVDLTHPPTAIPPKPGQPLSRLVIARADGSGEKAFTFQHIHILKWEPDKNLLLYLAGSADDNRVMALNPVTGISVTLTDALPERIYNNTYYDAWGRWWFETDGQRRFVVLEMSIDWAGTVGGGGTNEGAVYLAAWDGSVRRPLNRNITWADRAIWSPDGLQIAFAGRDLSYIPLLEFYSYDGHLIWKIPDEDTPAEFDRMSLVWIPCPSVR